MCKYNANLIAILLSFYGILLLPRAAALSIPLSRDVGKVSGSIISTLAASRKSSCSCSSGFGLFRRNKAFEPNALSLSSSSISTSSSAPNNAASDDSTKKVMYAVPSIFSPSDSRPIVLFDGKCNLCNWGVQLLLDYDRASDDARGNLRVAALQSRVGRILLDRMEDDVRDMVLAPSAVSKKDMDKNNKGDTESEDGEEENYKSIVVCSPDRTWVNTAAVLRMGRAMKFPFRPIALLAYLIPPFIRNRLYKVVSRTRKLVFGARDECRLWDDNWDMRFVDDALLGGKGSVDDPFADPNAPEVAEEDAIPVADVKIGDKVRIVSPDPILSNFAASHPEGVCVSGCIGRIVGETPPSGPKLVEFDEEELFGSSSSSTEHGKIRAYVRADQMVEV